MPHKSLKTLLYIYWNSYRLYQIITFMLGNILVIVCTDVYTILRGALLYCNAFKPCDPYLQPYNKHVTNDQIHENVFEPLFAPIPSPCLTKAQDIKPFATHRLIGSPGIMAT